MRNLSVSAVTTDLWNTRTVAIIWILVILVFWRSKLNQNGIYGHTWYMRLTEIFIKVWRTPREYPHKPYRLQKLESMLNIYIADGMGLPLLILMQLFSKSTQKNLHGPQNRI